MPRKWNCAVMLNLNDKWVVKRLRFGSYCMINCAETSNDIFLKFPIFNGWFQADVILEAEGCIILNPNPNPPIAECHIFGQWDVLKETKMTWTLQNYAYMRKLFQELMKWYFQALVGHTCCLLSLTRAQQIVCKAPKICQIIILHAKYFQSPCIYIWLFYHCILLFVNWTLLVFLVFYNTPQSFSRQR